MISLTADRSVVPVVLDIYRGAPLAFTVVLGPGVSLGEVQAIRCDIRHTPLDLDQPLASIDISPPAGEEPIIFEFSSQQMDLPMAGKRQSLAWLGVSALGFDAGALITVDPLVTAKLLVTEANAALRPVPAAAPDAGMLIVTPPLTGEDDPRGRVGSMCNDPVAGFIYHKVSVEPHVWVGTAAFTPGA